MISFIEGLGKYILLLSKVFRLSSKPKVFFKLTVREFYDLGVNSIPLVGFISFFMGMVLALQMYSNFSKSPLPVPNDYVTYASKVVMILEFSPTIISIILAGKIGSFITSSIGTMRVTEQIDALEIMGINAASFLILPKVVANLIFSPLLLIISYLIGVVGTVVIGEVSGAWSYNNSMEGIQGSFSNLYYYYSFTKMVVFAFVIATVPAYYGFYVKGGALEVGRASTTAVVNTSIIIIILNLVLTRLILNP